MWLGLYLIILSSFFLKKIAGYQIKNDEPFILFLLLNIFAISALLLGINLIFLTTN